MRHPQNTPTYYTTFLLHNLLATHVSVFHTSLLHIEIMIPSPVHMMGRLLNSVDRSTYRPTYTHSPSAQAFSGRSFDVDPDTGFFPSQPFRKLSGAFELWEKELEAARLVLKLGGDRGEEAMTKCAKGEQWRQHLRSVSVTADHYRNSAADDALSGPRSTSDNWDQAFASFDGPTTFLPASFISMSTRCPHIKWRTRWSSPNLLPFLSLRYLGRSTCRPC